MPQVSGGHLRGFPDCGDVTVYVLCQLAVVVAALTGFHFREARTVSTEASI